MLRHLRAAGYTPADSLLQYDIQVLRSGALRAFVGPHARLRYALGDGYAAEVALRLHILLTPADYVVLSLEARDDGNPSLANLAELCRIADLDGHWTTLSAEWEFDLPDSAAGASDSIEYSIAGAVKPALDSVFIALVGAALPRARVPPAELAGLVGHYERFYCWCGDQVRMGRMRFMYPNTWGTLVMARPAVTWSDYDAAAQVLVAGPPGVSGLDVEHRSSDTWWGVTNDRHALVFHPKANHSPDVEAQYECHYALAEYLALRHGVLSSVRRGTQAELLSGGRVKRRDVTDWAWATAMVTDDHLVTGDIRTRLYAAFRHLEEHDRLRDPKDLESQVSRNLQAFEIRLAAATDRASLVLAVLFGVVAASALVPFLLSLGAPLFGFDRNQETITERHPELYFSALAISALLLGSVAGIAVARARAIPVRGGGGGRLAEKRKRSV